MQGVNRGTTCISSMHANHEADERNRDTEYNYKSDNEDDDDSEPRSGA